MAAKQGTSFPLPSQLFDGGWNSSVSWLVVGATTMALLESLSNTLKLASNTLEVGAFQCKVVTKKKRISNRSRTYDPWVLLKKRTRFQEVILNVSRVGAVPRETATRKNSNLMHFEKISNKSPIYDHRELHDWRTRFREAILNVSQVGAFLRKIVSKKTVIWYIFKK